MKRVLIVCAALLVTLALATSAFSVTRHFSGTSEGLGGSVTFATKFKKGKTKKILTPIEFDTLPISCDQGNTFLDYRKEGKAIKVNKRTRKFSYETKPGGPNRTTIKGKFNKKGKKAHGTIRSRGTFGDGSATGCDTGELDWTAEK
jgi:hypothetical protein